MDGDVSVIFEEDFGIQVCKAPDTYYCFFSMVFVMVEQDFLPIFWCSMSTIPERNKSIKDPLGYILGEPS
jgi:hypothetical protein